MLEGAKATTETVDALRTGAAAMKAMQKATYVSFYCCFCLSLFFNFLCSSLIAIKLVLLIGWNQCYNSLLPTYLLLHHFLLKNLPTSLIVEFDTNLLYVT